jgi:hypothetical protein
MTTKLNLTIEQGKTFQRLLRWETTPLVYKAVSAITQAAPARVTATAHGVPPGWNVALTGVRGMTEINASQIPPKDADMHQATVVDANTLELNTVSAADFSAYAGGGYLCYYTPHDLASYTARMSIKDKVGGTLLVSLTTANSDITVDSTNHTILLEIDAVASAAFTWKKGVYDLELVSPTGDVVALCSGTVVLIPEVTT